MSKVLVTGANGFCGRHLVARLKAQGMEVHTLGPRPTAEIHHLADPTDLASVSDAVAAAKPDQVYHLAGVNRATHFCEFYQANVQYAAHLLRALEINNLGDAPVLLVGSAAEYGGVDPDDLPIDEDVEPRPLHHHGLSKWAQTQLALIEARNSRPIVVARPFNLVGPGMPPYLVAQAFASQIVRLEKGREKPPLRVGNLSPTRDFMDVDDAVDVFLALLSNPEAFGQVVNVCTGQEVSILTILSRLLELSEVQCSVEVDPKRVRSVEIPRHYGCRKKMARLTSLDPVFKIEEVLSKLLDWNRQNQ